MHQAKKKYGQNFIKDINLIKKIVTSAEINNKNVLEIGPGLGALTQFLVKDSKKYLAFEIDLSLKEHLTQFENEKSKIIYIDFMDVKENDINNYFNNEEVHLVGNLPYYITTPIIFKFLEMNQIKSATIMVQKEVGERMISAKNLKSYNAFSAILQYYTHVTKVLNVKKEMFSPVPKVDSMVVRLRKIERPYNDEFHKLYEKVSKLAFTQKRKTLVNNLQNGLNLSKDEIIKLISALHFDEKTRAEALSVENLIDLTLEIQKNNIHIK